MPNEDVRAALRLRNREDRTRVLWKVALGIPATLMGILFANLLSLPIHFGLNLLGIVAPYGTALLVFNGVLAIFIVIDVKRYPHERWHVPRYYQSDGTVKGHEFGSALPDSREDVLMIAELEHRKGVFAGVPLMTTISDPHNIAERVRVIASVLANFILGGPRSISRALDLRRRIADRSRSRTVASAEAFVAWLSSRGSAPEPDVKAHLAKHPDQEEGFALARELEVVTRRRNPVEFHYHVR
jgi:hypothetical protein